MTTTNTAANKIQGTGQHSHLVPTVEGQVVEMRDGHHEGTGIWLRNDGKYVFASYDAGTLEIAERCVLVRGQDADNFPEVYGCDLDSPNGLCLVGIDADDDLSWLDEEAEILWDSKA